MSEDVSVIDGNQAVKINAGAAEDGIELILDIVSNEGTPEERLAEAVSRLGADVVLYHFVTGAKTSGRNRAATFVRNSDDPVTQEELEAFMADWKPGVGAVGGPKKSDKDKAISAFKKLDADAQASYLDTLMGEIKAAKEVGEG
jgi:hypothetical protein